MKLHELKYNDGAVKNANRVGRGTSSGNGKTSGRGQKGQNSRSGGGVRLGSKVDKIHYSEKYFALISSTGISFPVHRRNASAPW